MRHSFIWVLVALFLFQSLSFAHIKTSNELSRLQNHRTLTLQDVPYIRQHEKLGGLTDEEVLDFYLNKLASKIYSLKHKELKEKVALEVADDHDRKTWIILKESLQTESGSEILLPTPEILSALTKVRLALEKNHLVSAFKEVSKNPELKLWIKEKTLPYTWVKDRDLVKKLRTIFSGQLLWSCCQQSCQQCFNNFGLKKRNRLKVLQDSCESKLALTEKPDGLELY